MVASGFDPEAKSAYAWLYKNDIDITCIQISPLTHVNQSYLLVDRIIPPLALEDMFAKVVKIKPISTPSNTAGGGQITRLKLPTTAEMFEQGQLKAGDIVMIKNQESSAARVVDYKAVDFGGKIQTWNAWAKAITKWSAVNIYANVTKDGKTLDELRGNIE